MEEILPDDYEKSINTIIRHLTPEGCIPMSKDALRGYIFGLAILPYEFPIEEWLIPIFGDEMPKFDSLRQQDVIFAIFDDLLNRFIIGFEEDRLDFPYDFNPFKPSVKLFNNIKEWCKGFIEAISFAPEFWHYDEITKVSKKSKNENELDFDSEELIISNVMFLFMISNYEDYYDQLKEIIKEHTMTENKKSKANIEINENTLKRELLKIFHTLYHHILYYARLQYLKKLQKMK